MKTAYIIIALSGIIGYNAFLASRDQQLFKAHDSACAHVKTFDPNCRYSK